ncbi:uncharacterized protein LOC128299845 [Anopheles moucheti]|uniref:uncharacterized protein LOC128299845 n=1 Tax=Anopheles moucheti TaxID=186751 RepID=UPI0022EFEEE1|nr:uncharacterized protein LOC128299845 [Anopheles moucheti]
MHGTSYHLRVALVIMLRAINLRRKGKLFDFTLTMEDPNAGQFDDVVFRYSLASRPEEFACVYIQAKHRQVKKTSITKDALLWKWNTKTQFSIPKYFTSYLQGYDPSLKGSHTYILCTNQSFDENLHDNNNFIPRDPDTDHIISFCDDIGATCYSFNSEKEIESLKDELRMTSLEKLGCMIAIYVHKKRQMQSNIYMFNINVNLIAKCVEIRESGTFQFNEEFRAADESTLVGILRSGFVQEYIKLTRKNEVKWENVRIKVDQSFSESILNINQDSLYGETQYYETVDVVIQQFFDKFLFVCGSMSESQLLTEILKIMPPWVSNPESTYNNLQNMLLESMTESSNIHWHDLKIHLIKTKANEVCSKVIAFSNDYQKTTHSRYSHIIVKTNCLEDTGLHDFINNGLRGDVYRYRCATNMQLNSLIVSQTLAMHHFQCLFVDNATLPLEGNIADFVNELMEFIAAVDLSKTYIITILGQQENAALKEIRNLTKSHKMKLIVVEAPSEEDPSEDRLSVRNLVEDNRMQLFKNHRKFKLFGTKTELDEIVSLDDSLSFLCSTLDKCDKPDMEANLNQTNFEKIKPWYIPRSCSPYSDDKYDPEQYLIEKEITAEMVHSILSYNHEANRLQDAFKNENNVKVHIFLDEAGYGKSTYFTWLASALSNDNESLYVVRMNASQHSTDFYELQTSNPKTLDDTEVIRIFYRLLYMTLFVPNIHLRSIKETLNERQKADRIAQLLKVSKGKTFLDAEENAEHKFPLEQLLQLRLFITKFNEMQLICLLDGFDEIAPHYKDFVMTYFARLVAFDGIRNLFLSTRPYNFKGELKYTFSGCKMWRLEPFSQRDRMLYLNNFLEHEIKDNLSNRDHSSTIFKTVYNVTIHSIQDLKLIPLFLHMAVKFSLSKVKTLHTIHEQGAITELFDESKFDQLQVITNFIEEKLRILNDEKPGAIGHASLNPIQRLKNDDINRQIIRRHNLIAMLVIFTTNVRAKLLSNEEQQKANEFLQDIIQAKEKTGIVLAVQNDTPQFAHRSFAEYFAAAWIYDNKHLIDSKDFFRSTAFWTATVHRTRDFLNRMIVRDSERSDIHMAVINQSEQQVRALLSKDPSIVSVKDAVGRLPLHLAVMYPSEEIQQLLIANMPSRSINTKDELFQWTALDYAFAMRSNISIKILLTTKAQVNEKTLLDQLLSNDLNDLLINAHEIGVWLQTTVDLEHNLHTFFSKLVENLMNDKKIDLLSPYQELDNLTVLEFCTKRNFVDMLELFLIRIYEDRGLSTQQVNQLLQIASENKAHAIITYFEANVNMLLPQIKSVDVLIAAIKSSIKQEHLYLLQLLFHQLCLQRKIYVVDDTDILTDDYAPGEDRLPWVKKTHYPNFCCVRSSDNVGIFLPEYDEKDTLHEGYLIEALLATAVHEGNLLMVKYIVQKTNTTITNRLIVMVMRLLPKKGNVCHEQSMDVFSYLLERTIDLESIDDEGRNLLHMTAQNGCFFMLRCLIAKGFDPTVANTRNGWNVFDYVVFGQNEDRTDKILEFLWIKCDVNWFQYLDKLVETDRNSTGLITNQNKVIQTARSFVGKNKTRETVQNTQNSKKLNKQQHALLAVYAIYSLENQTKLLSDLEQQEAIRCMREVAQGLQNSRFIRKVRGDVVQFYHRSFAEYFVASWIYDNKHRIRRASFFRSWVYWGVKTHQTRDFLNRMIIRDSERSDIHMAVINQSVEQVRALLSKDPSIVSVKDAVGRLPLHLAVEYPPEEIQKLLIEKMPFELVNTTDELFKWTALDYAFAKRYEASVEYLLAIGAVVDEDNLLEQIMSNNLWSIVWGVHFYGKWLNSHKHSKMNANRLHIRSVEYLLHEKHLDVFARRYELDALSLLEYCSKHNIIGVFQQLVSQLYIGERISTDLCSQLLQIASENKAHGIVAYFLEENNILLPQMKSVAELISAVKSCINRNQISSFKGLFHALCLRISTHMVDDTDIVVDDYAPGDDSILPLDKKHYPKTCCVQSSTNVGIFLPKYDEKDTLHEGYLIEALLATAVHEGNMPMVKYIVQKTNMAISNRIIVMVMRLLPKKDDVCHEQSMDVFMYLLERTIDLESIDDEGRNLLHMTAQNGCFFMLRCLIVKGFDPTVANTRNGSNVFHYVAFNQDEDRTDKILEFLLIKGYMHWFDDLDRMVDSDTDALNANTNQNTQSKEMLNKQQYALLALYVIFSKEDLAKLLSDPEQQEAMQCLREAGQSNAKTSIIQQVRDGIPKFAQVIFAEYYAACWIFDNQQRMRSESFFRSWTFWTGYSGSSKQYRTRDFLNRLTTKDSKRCDLHLAVINQSAEQVHELLSKDPSVVFEKNVVGRLPLHLAATYPSEEIVNMLTEKMSRQVVNTKDDIFQWTALDYAFVNRYQDTVQHLLTVGAVVDEDNLLQQILSNNLRSLIWSAHYYADFLNSHDHSRAIANRLQVRSVEYLLYQKQLDVFSRHKELQSLTVLEFCSKHNMIGIFKHLVSHLSIRERISTELSSQLFQIALENKAHDIKAYFVDENNWLLLQMKSVAELISAVKSCINRNQISSFKGLFHALCLRISTHMVDDTDIVVDDYTPGDDSIPPLDKKHYPKTCCVQSSTNVGMPLPEYDEKDTLHEGYLIEALLAAAVHEGNMPMVKYIVQKTNMAISNRIIVMVMRLLPKKGNVCHEQSMDVFKYLLERTIDLESIDDEGRNLLLMTAQNGCFFMLRCLIAKGFDPTVANTRNGWNVFHYVAFNQDEDRTDKILEFLLIKGYMHWFDDLDRMVDSDTDALNANTNQNTQSTKKLNKQQLGLLAIYAIHTLHGLTIPLSYDEQQEALQCIREVAQGNATSGIIREVKDGVPQFTLRIFAYYFAASWIYDNKHRMRSASFFRSSNFWHSGYEGRRILDFLNRLILKDSDRSEIHIAVINQSEEQVRELLSKDPSIALVKDAVGRYPLHLAVMYPSKEIVKLLSAKMPFELKETKDELFQWTVSDYAMALPW